MATPSSTRRIAMDVADLTFEEMLAFVKEVSPYFDPAFYMGERDFEMAKAFSTWAADNLAGEFE